MIDLKELLSNWKIITLGELSSLIQYGLNASAEQEGKGFLYLRISDINDDGNVNLANPKYLSKNTQNVAKYVLEPGDIIIARSGSVGRSFVYQSSNEPWVFASYLIRFRIRKDLAYPDYIGFFMRSLSYRKYIDKMSRSVAQANINSKELSKLPIPLPPLPEQRRIIDILREADEIRCLRKQANDKTKQILPSIFEETFGEVDNSWEEGRLNDVIKKLSPGKSFAASSQPAREGKLGVLKVSAVTQGVFKPEENKELPDNLSFPTDYEVENGDLIISRANTQELVGASAIVRNTRRGLLRSDKLWKVVLHKEPKVNVYFLWALLNTPKLRLEIGNRSTGTSSSMRNISQDKFLDIQVKLPPKPLQDEFEEKVKLLWEQNDDQENSANKLDSLFKSLLAQAFTGELTASWREQHQSELAAAERDQLLQISQPVDTEELADEEASETKISELHRDRDELLRSLSKSQWKIYELVIQETAYFTPEHLEEKYSIPRNIGHKSLQLLAAAGLIVPVTLPTPTSSGLHYESAYRNLNQYDDTRYSDDALLEKDAV
ncbi:restriction endonuclease subunit S [Nostoc sp. WHI]|uniref:restriction endonuclease subunit S n=1 Tax=Nostoc sp. WHI TaxID=2650611 RepID=UPI0018C8124D|nr:restriction endonuclease subunit S [Nostoc sp. WHI]MBG1268057.1 hypothetical protein [Nostoc sp. WHI]